VAAVRKNEPDARIIVVDDGLDRFGLPLGDIFLEPGVKPFIFARNANIGIKACTRMVDVTTHSDPGPKLISGPFGDDVVLLNDDALLESVGGFTLLSECCAADPSIGIIGATTNVTGQTLQWRQNVGLRQVPHIAFVCVFIPRTTINRIGMLDEQYCIDYGVEDRDYCEAVNRAGLKVCVHDGCYVDHGSLVSSFRGDPKTPRPYMQNLALFRKKWGHV